jgi:hypothetical protein
MFFDILIGLQQVILNYKGVYNSALITNLYVSAESSYFLFDVLNRLF